MARASVISRVDFQVAYMGGLRTPQEQYKLFREGVSQLDGTHSRSNHQSGRAVDVVAYVNGKPSWDERHLAHVAAAVLQAANELGIRVEWGGFWRSFRDLPHFELPESHP